MDLILLIGGSVCVGIGVYIFEDHINLGAAILVLGILGIYMAGIQVHSQTSILQKERSLVSENLYIISPATNVVKVMPAYIDTSTATIISRGEVYYFQDLILETNSGPVVAIRFPRPTLLYAAYILRLFYCNKQNRKPL